MSEEITMVRIRFWQQDTLESGHWEVSGLMGMDSANRIIEANYYSQAEIVKDEEGWPLVDA
jgi:hypothetical protein